MEFTLGTSASSKEAVVWDDTKLVNPHIAIMGTSGAGKTYTMRKLINQCLSTYTESQRTNHKFEVFDVHGDIDIPQCSNVLFSEQTKYGLNPFLVNPDPHYGGVRKKLRGFISIINKTSRKLGDKQEGVLRNIIMDTFKAYGFNEDDPKTWSIDTGAKEVAQTTDGRIYIDVPFNEQDDAKALGAGWDQDAKKWFISIDEYQGAITKWPPKIIGKSNPSLEDVLRTARFIARSVFMGVNQNAIVKLEQAQKAGQALHKKRLQHMRSDNTLLGDEKLEEQLAKARDKAISAYTEYANSITTGTEIEELMKYNSADVLLSVLNKLENLNSVGIFKTELPPFDDDNNIWRYNLKALGLEERKMFVLFRCTEIFEKCIQLGETKELRRTLVIDEAPIFMDDDPDNILTLIAREGRKFGLQLIIASQSPEKFPDDIISSIATKIILGIDERFWKPTETKMNVERKALEWVVLQKSLLIQTKSKGENKTKWVWTYIS